MTAKELKTAYMAEIAKAWGDDAPMMRYFEKKLSSVYELTGGKLFAYKKPKIQNRFCFGYGYCAISTEEDRREAASMARYSATSEDYFMSRNLEGIDGLITLVQTGRPSYAHDWEEYTVKLYPKQYIGSPVLNIWEVTAKKPGEPDRINGENNAIALTEADKALLLAALNTEREKLTKRLKTYLKRYGMSKIKSWSYILD